MSYVVFIHVNGGWTKVSRAFEHEHEAQEWALDLDGYVTRRVERVPDE